MEKMTIKIDRSNVFDPGPFECEMMINEQDARSIALTEIDINKVMFQKVEGFMDGEDRLNYLKEKNFVRLDAKVFQTLWENQYLIPEKWKEQTNGDPTNIFFDGTILGDSDSRFAIYLSWDGEKWTHGSYFFDYGFGDGDVSAVLVDK